ncbi:3-alpha,7-alpha,12-alpha-trihydroxy-5-beta-cholest-24-enoyl-CoA hydratase [Streptomyces umbrinus]|uniref:MaoC/PaaZ C-terminal domain-containing protein n=1 Tax=Streptomyces umbrinus TaxID=67370 RepID=UPI001679DE22|nr:MaoC/PaaZ C-terminal domain-containing protein [Streptomyces umbrinus]GHB83014.1 3-alpha,7-alpha,12-alpha-trihydroxy-5-beta-cholest-24-enoyl-CoA hydratase [Streptomyces umbrinus]
MPINDEIAGRRLPAATGSWTGRDTRLYALAVGAGGADPGRELQFTTDNTAGVTQRVLPTFGVIEGCRVGVGGLLHEIDGVDLSRMLHGTQQVEQHRELPTDAEVITSGRVSAVWDKGKAAVIETEAVTADAESGEPYVTSRQSLYFRGYGGWGGERGPSSRSPTPEAKLDRTLEATTRLDQALLYRLTGDTNPLHSDPAYARAAGFPQPILHGLCVYGIVGRLLLNEFADGDPAAFRSLRGRFSAPTYPGDDLVVSVSSRGPEHPFVVDNQRGERILSDGLLVTA